MAATPFRFVEQATRRARERNLVCHYYRRRGRRYRRRLRRFCCCCRVVEPAAVVAAAASGVGESAVARVFFFSTCRHRRRRRLRRRRLSLLMIVCTCRWRAHAPMCSARARLRHEWPTRASKTIKQKYASIRSRTAPRVHKRRARVRAHL